MTPIVFVTIVLDGMPWLPFIYPTLSGFSMPWRWIVVEGVADNKHCTQWCAKLDGRLSNDGTTEYLDRISLDPRVTVLRKPLWDGKVSMFNAALALIDYECLLWQMDADELWNPWSICNMITLMDQMRDRTHALFYCRYFVGPNLYIANRECYGNHTAYEWKRLWRVPVGAKFISHEPPLMSHETRTYLTQGDTESFGCVFDHLAYASRKQMEFRSRYYAGDANPNAHHWRQCLTGWDKLQKVEKFPVLLRNYLPWVQDDAMVMKLPQIE